MECGGTHECRIECTMESYMGQLNRCTMQCRTKSNAQWSTLIWFGLILFLPQPINSLVAVIPFEETSLRMLRCKERSDSFNNNIHFENAVVFPCEKEKNYSDEDFQISRLYKKDKSLPYFFTSNLTDVFWEFCGLKWRDMDYGMI